MSLSIIIPVYNEEECIGKCIEETLRTFEGIDKEIIVVDDGSKDGSHKIISEFAQNNKNIKYIHYIKNKGYSYAIRTGFRKATKKYASFIDADLKYTPKDLLRMYLYALKHKSAFIIGQSKKNYYNLGRYILSRMFNCYVRILFNMNIKDANSLKLMERKYLNNINFRMDYGMIELECLIGFKLQGIKINKMPIVTQKRIAGSSKCSFKIVCRTVIDSLKLRLRLKDLIK